MISKISLGATYLGGGQCNFRVWAPSAQHVEVQVLSPSGRVVPLQNEQRGYHQALVERIEPGTLYRYRLDGQKERPDPASRFQPQGVHGPSQVIDPGFAWNDASWSGLPLLDYLIYEVHTGTFTADGTFEAMIPHLEELKDPRDHRLGTHAGSPVSGHPELGLRWRLPVCGPELLRRS